MINDTTTFLRRARIAQPVITAKVLIFKWSKLHPDRCTDDKSVTSLYSRLPPPFSHFSRVSTSDE